MFPARKSPGSAAVNKIHSKGIGEIIMFNLKTVLVATILIIGGIVAANAQVPGSPLHANIPISFVVNDKVFPAGEYTIQRQAGFVSSPSALVLQGEGHAIAFNTIGSTSNNASRFTELVFDKVGDRYFLSQIRYNGDTAVNELPKTRAQKRFIAQNSVQQVVFTGSTF
jgi:hypothetical protein